jgi:hypothetical protein
MTRPRTALKFWIVVSLLTTAGCSGRPAAIQPPDIDPQEVAAGAIEQYDTNVDGTIDQKELESAPSLRFSLDRIDANGDSKLVANEIAEFAQKHWLDRATGIIRLKCEVKLDGRPLDGATVVLEPEAFLDGAVKPASGVTRGGTATLDVADADRPHPNAHGVQNGLYLVRITKTVDGQEQLPKKFNKQTVLGCEVADRASYMPGPLGFNLSTR